MPLHELLNNQPIRTVWDEGEEKWWYSAVDLCAAIKNCDHKTASDYWHWLNKKWQTEAESPVSLICEINFKDNMGRKQFASALDLEGVLRLIQVFPGVEANPLRLWIAEVASENAHVVGQFVKLAIAGKCPQSLEHQRATKKITRFF